MPFVQKILLYVPIFPLGVIAVVGTVVLSMAGLFIVRKFVPHEILKMHNELINALFGAIALAYTVLLAFVVVVSWQNFDKAQAHVESEANSLVDLHRASGAFAQPFKDELRTALESYERLVVTVEWDMLARGEESLEAKQALGKAWDLYCNYEPKNEREKIFLATSVTKLCDLRETRRMRIIDSRTGVHPVLWFVLIVGGIATISFTFFFGTDSFVTHAVMTSILAVLIALILFTILSFDYPFTGSVRLHPDIFLQITNF
jgi:ABC-type multidrug transport system fused ATPase/permease subunit